MPSKMQLEEEQILAAKTQRFPFIQFVEPLETEFRHYRHQRLLQRVPTVGLAALGIFFIFAILDFLTLPKEVYTTTTAIRIFIICPLIGLSILASYQRLSIRAYSFCYLSAYIIAGFSVIAIICAARINNAFMPYDGVLLHIVFGYFMMGMPYTLATFASSLVSLAYFGLEFYLDTPSGELASNAFFIITLNLMGSMGSYMQERSRRLLFLNEKLVELAKTKDQTEIESKTRLVATASHDLRQPLHAMNLLVESLENQLKPSIELNITQKLKESIRQLSQLLGSLLNISRLNAGIVEASLRTFDLAPLISNLTNDQTGRAKQLGIHLVHQGCSPCFIHSDPILVERVFRNLCENAFEHAQASEVTVSWTVEENQVRLSIKDNGIGIPASDINNIFDEFQQLGQHHKSGMGLGLAIVKQLSELLDAELEVHSKEGQGTCFWMTLKRSNASSLETTPAPDNDNSNAVAGHRIYVVDDDLEILDSMSILLENWGYNVSISTKPEEAIDDIKTHPADLIISDYRFPESTQNGLTFINTLRQNSHQPLPCILITADTHSDITKGMDELISKADQKITQVALKPLQPAKLKLMIQHFLNSNQHN